MTDQEQGLLEHPTGQDPIADRGPRPKTWQVGDYGLIFVLIMVSCFVFAALYGPRFIRPKHSGGLTACKSNCKNIGSALEMYSTDHEGKYPPKLSKLVPNYLKVIPECLDAGRVTYKLRTVDPKGVYVNYYEFCCEGSNHEYYGIYGDYPYYDAVGGLIERP